MSSVTLGPRFGGTQEELQNLRSSWGWFLALGIAMVVMGTIALGYACTVSLTLAATWLFGVVTMAAGIAQIVSAFSVGRWGGTLVHLLMGILYAVVGFMIFDQPAESALQLTLIIALFLMIGGIFRAVSALTHRFPGWGWVLLNGVVTALLGLLIYKQWPGSGLWFIGLYIGIDLLLNGWMWVALAFALRKLPARA
ncbi:MAG: HdeD family acid-resistance protein [Pirellulales bacterium]